MAMNKGLTPDSQVESDTLMALIIHEFLRFTMYIIPASTGQSFKKGSDTFIF